MTDDRIVLLDPDGNATGTAPKVASHHQETPLHLAFSCYLMDQEGRVLITQRASGKATWPGVWTNSCCGHPAPGERLQEAVRRRLRTELGVEADGLTLLLPEFRYRAVMANGVVENELCPVVRATLNGSVEPNPAEVAGVRWLDWPECVRLAQSPAASPWYRLQMDRLVALGAPGDWPDADPSRLPPAATW